MSYQFVRMVNTGDKDYDFQQEGVKKIIKPGKDMIVPWKTAAAWLGDPTLMDVPKNPQRTRAHNQVRGYYNYEVGTTSAEEWEAARPHIEVYDLETSERIYMIIEDPEGERGMPEASTSTGSDVEILQRQVALLTSQITRLVEDREQRATETVSTPTLAQGQQETVSTDAPGTVDGDAGLEDGALDFSAQFASNVENGVKIVTATPTMPVTEDAPHEVGVAGTHTLPPRPDFS